MTTSSLSLSCWSAEEMQYCLSAPPLCQLPPAQPHSRAGTIPSRMFLPSFPSLSFPWQSRELQRQFPPPAPPLPQLPLDPRSEPARQWGRLVHIPPQCPWFIPGGDGNEQTLQWPMQACLWQCGLCYMSVKIFSFRGRKPTL